MDTFDVRKYITEQNIKEQEGYERRYAITFKDGSTEEVGKHISVSPEDVMGSLRKSFERQGKPVIDIKHLGIKPVGIYESDEDELGSIVSWAADTLDFELSPRMQDAIANSLEQGIPSNIIKKQLSSKNPIKIREEKDVIEPEEGEETPTKKDDKIDNKDKENGVDEEYVKSIKKRLSKNISKNKDRLDSKYIDKKAFLKALNLLTKSKAFSDNLEGRDFDDSEEDYSDIIESLGMLYSFATLPPNYTEDDLKNSLRVMDYLLMDSNLLSYTGGDFILSSPENTKYYLKNSFSPDSDLVFNSEELSFVKK